MTNFIVELPKKQAHLIDHLGKQWWTLQIVRIWSRFDTIITNWGTGGASYPSQLLCLQ